MGQGGHITIINNTDSTMKKTLCQANQMEAWSFPEEIPAWQRARVYVEWCDGVFTNTSHDRGTVVYTLSDGSGRSLRLTMANAITRSMTVELTGMAGPGIITSCPVQWRHDGEMYLVMDDRMDLKCWMGKVPGDTPVNKMDIPGTHDSLCFSITGFAGAFAPSAAKAQKMNIWDQLSYGSRYLDIRIDENLNGCHGVADCENGLRDTMEVIRRFLEANRTEVIFMRIVNERSVSDKEAFRKRMDDIISSYGHLFCKRECLDKWPTLDEVRGRIIFLDDLKDHYLYEKGFGLVYDMENRFDIQDDYDKPDENTKLNKIKENIDKPYAESVMKLNHVSAVGTAAGLFGLGWSPEDYANYLNPRVIDFTVNKSVDCVMGIVAFDFFDAMVSSPVVINNCRA